MYTMYGCMVKYTRLYTQDDILYSGEGELATNTIGRTLHSGIALC